MANKKEYLISINGIDRAVTDVDKLFSKIVALQKEIATLQKASINVNSGDIDTTALKEVSALQKEIAQNAKLQDSEYLALLQKMEQMKSSNKAIKDEQKQIAQGVKDTSGAYTNTLAGQRAYLSDLKKQLSTMNLGTKEWEQLRNKVSQVNDNVKELEESYGVFTRNVGNYSALFEGVDKFKVTVGETVMEFNNLNEATEKSNKALQSIGAQMMALEKEGKKDTEEFKKLNEEFENLAGQIDALEKVQNYTKKLGDAVKDDSGALGEFVRGFDEFNSVVQVGTGIMGLFGNANEDVTKAINRTVQMTTILRGIQNLLNNDLQKGGVINRAYAVTQRVLATAFGTTATSAGIAATAIKAFSAALVGTGVGAIVVGLGMLVNYLLDLAGASDDAGNAIKDGAKKAEDFSKTLKNLAEDVEKIGRLKVKLGLSDEIETAKENIIALISAYKRLEEQRGKMKFPDIKFDGTEESIKSMVDTLGKLKSMYETYKKIIEETNGSTDKNVQKTREGLQLWVEQYEVLMKLVDAFGDLKTAQDKVDKDKASKAKEQAEKQKKIDEDYLKFKQKIEDDITSTIKSAHERRLKEIEIARKREIADAEKAAKENKKIAKDLGEAKAAINAKFNKQILDEEKAFGETLLKNAQAVSLAAANIYRQMLNIDFNLSVDSNSLDQQLADAFKFDENRLVTPLTKGVKKVSDAASTIFTNLQTNMKSGSEMILQQVDLLEKTLVSKTELMNNQLAIESADLFNQAGNTLETFLETYKKDLEDSGEEANQFYKSMKVLSDNLRFVNPSTLAENSQQIQQMLDEVQKAIGGMPKFEEAVFQDVANLLTGIANQTNRKLESINAEALANTYTLQQEKLNSFVELYSKEIDELDDIQVKLFQDLSTGFSDVDIAGNLLKVEQQTKRLSKSYDELGKNIAKQTEEAKKQAKELDEQVSQQQMLLNILTAISEIEPNDKGIITIPQSAVDILKQFGIEIQNASISVDDLNAKIEGTKAKIVALQNASKSAYKSIADFSQISKSIEAFKKQSEKDWKDWANMIGTVAMAAVNTAADALDKLAQIEYNNTKAKLDAKRKELDEESEMISEQLDEATEKYQEYNQKINEIEGELSTARGDRRLALLDNLNAEMQKREEAYNLQVKLQKQQEANDKKKEKLAEEQEKAEKKRNKQQQIANIAKAVMSTAVGVATALEWGFPLGPVFAAIIGAMGAVEIALIASQKFAKGGIIEGASHENGGVKVLGGRAEVEGGEFITNKKTTEKNADLLYYINSKNKQITLNDLLTEFFGTSNKSIKKPSVKTSFAQGGTLPNNAPTLNTRQINSILKQDDKPVVVSVVDIIDATDNYNEVRLLAGEID